MEPGEGLITAGVFLFSLILTFIGFLGIKGIVQRRIKIGEKVYLGGEAIAPSAILLFLGFVPFILFLDAAISAVFNLGFMFPLILLICGAAVIFVMFYSYAMKSKL